MEKLERLFNSLIEKGWIPRGDKNWENNTRITNIYFRQDENGKLPHIRMIVSKESGLWQFVCENGMVDDGVEYKGYALVDVDGGAIAKYETGCRYLYSNIEPEFYIIESALRDESELEQFLLDNIKVGNEQL